jgi:hypothetical protein
MFQLERFVIAILYVHKYTHIHGTAFAYRGYPGRSSPVVFTMPSNHDPPEASCFEGPRITGLKGGYEECPVSVSPCFL